MNCRLCGQPTAGPSKLCVDCDAALRRARKGSTVSGTSPRRRADSGAGAGRTVDLPPRPVRQSARFAPRRLIVWAACGLIVTAGVYFGKKGLEPRLPVASALSTNGVAQQAASPLVVAPPSATLSPPSARPEGPGRTVEDAAPISPPRAVAPTASRQGSGKKASVATAARTGPAPSPVAGPSRDTVAGGTPRKDPDSAPQPEVPPPITLASAPSRQPIGSPERWKGLANAVAKCGEKAGLRGNDLRAEGADRILRRSVGTGSRVLPPAAGPTLAARADRGGREPGPIRIEAASAVYPCRGSRASRSPSPSRLNDTPGGRSTARARTAIHGALSM